jgi:hypothetical protein
MIILILGSGPNVLAARDWPRAPFDRIVAINNAHMVRPDWDDAIFPHDFPPERHPFPSPGQRLVTEADFVPAQNAFGGFVYAGGTMAFTAAYWALHHHRPRVIAMMGCDMHYPPGQTHFYGSGTPDPLRQDITLQSLEAKSARLMTLAAREGCAMVNLSDGPSRLVFPRAHPADLPDCRPLTADADATRAAMGREAELGYACPTGRYWETPDLYDAAELARLDALWLAATAPTP